MQYGGYLLFIYYYEIVKNKYCFNCLFDYNLLLVRKNKMWIIYKQIDIFMYLQIQKIFRGGGVGCWVGVMNNCIFWELGMGQMFFLMNFLSLIFLGSLDFILFRFVYVYIVCIYIYIFLLFCRCGCFVLLFELVDGFCVLYGY